jgi:hypothetical protein
MDKKVKEWIMELYQDPELMERFKKDPKGVLKEKGVTFPEDVTVQVLADTEKVKYMVIPYLGLEKITSASEFEERISKSSSFPGFYLM